MTKVQLLKNAFKPGTASSRTVLKRGEIVELTTEEADELIEKKVAAPFEEPKAPKAEKAPKAPKAAKDA